MAQLRPVGGTRDPRFTHSSYVHPVMPDGIRSVLIDEHLHNIGPETLDFVLSFVHDNNLQLVGTCILLGDSTSTKA